MVNNQPVKILVTENNQQIFRAFSDALFGNARKYGVNINITCATHLAQAKLKLSTDSFSVIAVNTDAANDSLSNTVEVLAGLKVLKMRIPHSNNPHILLYCPRKQEGLGRAIEISNLTKRRVTAVEVTDSYERLALLALDLYP